MRDKIIFVLIGAVLISGLSYALIKGRVKLPTSSVASEKAEILKVKADDHVRGSLDAPITIVEYSDFQCPYCVKYAFTLQEIMVAYPGKIKWVFRHYPLPFHQAAKGAGISAEAAGNQGKFWEYADILFEKSQADGTGLANDDFVQYALQLGMDVNQFSSDAADPKYEQKINSNTADGDKLKITGTPASFMIDSKGNIQDLTGNVPYDQLKLKIDAILNK
ncbi:MAG: thioredoxin domain-containing protein [Patescibacteria group bacterium]|jgi:protein-disulfide isomerase